MSLLAGPISGLTHSFILSAVTLDQVKAGAQKYLQPDALVITVVKPAA
jgi:predicted Zn-dependent peptidase